MCNTLHDYEMFHLPLLYVSQLCPYDWWCSQMWSAGTLHGQPGTSLTPFLLSLSVYMYIYMHIDIYIFFFFFAWFVFKQIITHERWPKNLAAVCVQKMWNIRCFTCILASETRISRLACFLVFLGYTLRLRGELECFLRIPKPCLSIEQLQPSSAEWKLLLDEDKDLVTAKFQTAKGWSKHNPLFKFIWRLSVNSIKIFDELWIRLSWRIKHLSNCFFFSILRFQNHYTVCKSCWLLVRALPFKAPI